MVCMHMGYTVYRYSGYVYVMWGSAYEVKGIGCGVIGYIVHTKYVEHTGYIGYAGYVGYNAWRGYQSG